ncbi:MAG: alpha/beta hydrolase [Bacillota bacterium]|nr:alpha/beta hydrolase [Bacillota bacterium]
MSMSLEGLMRAAGLKKTYSDETKYAEYIEKQGILNEKPYSPPRRILKKSHIRKAQADGMDYYVLRGGSGTVKKQILYLHGGAYIAQPTPLHWDFLLRLLENLDAEITVPIYPKAPRHQFQEAFEKVLKVYEEIITRTEPKEIVVMGDSAGGGFSLALAQLLQKKELPQPGNIILISPWLDITMTNPEIPSLEKLDPMLGTQGLIEAGKAWAGGQAPDYYLLSPINGDIKGLGSISLFIGTHEILLPDARRFRDIAEEQGSHINYYEYEEMFHVFPAAPIPEAKKAIDEMVRIIKLDNSLR